MKFLKRILLLMLTMLLMGSLVLASIFLISGDKAPEKAPRVVTTSAGTLAGTRAEAAGATMTLDVNDLADTQLLHLINTQYAVPSDGPKDLINTANEKFRLRRTAAEAVDAFMAKAKKQRNGLYITSGYRTRSEQAAIWKKTKNKGFVQPVGHSEHQTGLAVDLVPLKSLEGADEATLRDQQDYMARNGWKYGLIKRYPAGKEAITGIDHEYWHFRYIGMPHAAYIQEHGLVLEEYLDHLEASGNLTMTVDGAEYTVCWRKARKGKINLPRAKEFSVSSTNTGAWIVTIRNP